MKYKFHMFGVIRSYKKLTGFQPVEFLLRQATKVERKDECSFSNSNVP